MTGIQKLKEAAQALSKGSSLEGPAAHDAMVLFEGLATPDTVLELIAEIGRLKEDRERIRGQRMSYASRLEEAIEVRDELKAENESLIAAMNEILRVTPMGVEAFGIAALVIGELGVTQEPRP